MARKLRAGKMEVVLVRVLRHKELTLLADWMIETLSPPQRHDIWWRALEADAPTYDLCVARRTADDSPVASAAWRLAVDQIGAEE